MEKGRNSVLVVPALPEPASQQNRALAYCNFILMPSISGIAIMIQPFNQEEGARLDGLQNSVK